MRRVDLKEILFILAITFSLLFVLLISPIRVLRVTSGSMEPAYKTGSLLMVNRACSISKVKEGDVIVFLLPGKKKAAHRVVEKRENGFITKGDANNACDLFLVTKDNFWGKIITWKDV